MNKKEQRDAKIARQQEIVNQARQEQRELTTSEQLEFNTLQRDIDTLTNEIRAEENGTHRDEGNGNNDGEGSSEGDRERDLVAERARVTSILALSRSFPNIKADEYIKNGSSVDQVREAIINSQIQTGAPVNTRNNADITVNRAEEDKYRDAAADALILRSGISLEKPSDGAGEMRGMSLRDLGIDCLTRSGERSSDLIRMNNDELYEMLCRQFYNPTSAFPAILDEAIKKSVVKIYNEVPTTFQEWTTKGSLKDFKTTADHEYLIGGAGRFEKVGENGELKADKPSSVLLPNRKLDTYGRQFSMTRQAFINDDIGFITEIPGLYSMSAKKTIDKQVYEIVYNNPAIYDGMPLFNDNHKNLIKNGSKPTQASIQAAILQLQKQTDPFGEPIYMVPGHLVVPVGYEFDLSVIFGSTQVTGSNNNDINPLHNYPIKVVQSPVLNALAKDKACPWFLTASPQSARGIQVDYLNGQEQPTVRRMEQAGVLGFTWDIYLDWGIAVRDFRGIAKNPGAVIG